MSVNVEDTRLMNKKSRRSPTGLYAHPPKTPFSWSTLRGGNILAVLMSSGRRGKTDRIIITNVGARSEVTVEVPLEAFVET